jgi:hypothetical protein
MTQSDTTTFGTSIPREHEGLLERFEAELNCGSDGANSRSDEVVRAMRVYLAVRSATDSTDAELPENAREAGHAVRQMVLDWQRLERAGELEPALDRADGD